MPSKFYSVSTPAVFREIELPADDSTWTDDEEAQLEELRALAEEYHTHVTTTPYRRG